MSGCDLPFPAWMSAVQDEMMEISNRMAMVGLGAPPMPTPMGAAYALYGRIDPKIAAVMIMKDAIDMHRRLQMP